MKKIMFFIILMSAPAFAAKTVVSVLVSPHGSVIREGDTITLVPSCTYSDSTTDACVSGNAGSPTVTSFQSCLTTSGLDITWTSTGVGGICDPGNSSITAPGTGTGPFPSGEFTAQFYGKVCYQGICDKFGGLAERIGDTIYPYITPDYRQFQSGENFQDVPYDLDVVVGSTPQIGLGIAYNSSAPFVAGEPAQEIPNWASSDPTIATVDRYGKVTVVGTGAVTITANPFYSTNAAHGDSIQSGWTYANGGNGINLVGIAPTVVGKHWYARIHGGNTYYDPVLYPSGDCDGTVDVDFPGTAHHCALGSYSQFFWNNNAGTNNDNTAYNKWIISGGDHVHFQAGTPGYAVGAVSAQPTNPTTQCYWPGGTYCTGPPVPSGTAANPTTIEGENIGNCSADSQKSVLLGTGNAKFALNLIDSQFVKISCIRLTQLLTCGITTGCLTDSTPDQSAGQGFWVSALTSGVTLEDVIVDGLYGAGIFGATGYDGLHLNRFRASFNPNGNINTDDAPWTLSSMSVAGGLTATNFILEWAGCSEIKGTTLVVPAYECRDHNNGNGGDPDAIGEGNASGFWSFDHGICRYAQEDCFDLLHVQMQYFSMTNTQVYGQIGASFKIGPSDGNYMINNQSTQNCQRTSVPVLDQPSSSIPGTGDYCRGNDWMGYSFRADGTYVIADNSMTGYQGVIFDGGCGFGYTTCTPASAVWTGNAILGYSITKTNDTNIAAVGPPGISGQGANLPIFTHDYNIWFGTANCPPLSPHESCNTDDPLFVNEPVQTPSNVQTRWDNFNFFPTPSSPLVGGGTTVTPPVTTDICGNTRTSPPWMGSYNAFTCADGPATGFILRSGHIIRSGVRK